MIVTAHAELRHLIALHLAGGEPRVARARSGAPKQRYRDLYGSEVPHMERRTVTKAAVKRSAARSTEASARLERRILPEGYVRSKGIALYLAERRQKT